MVGQTRQTHRGIPFSLLGTSGNGGAMDRTLLTSERLMWIYAFIVLCNTTVETKDPMSLPVVSIHHMCSLRVGRVGWHCDREGDDEFLTIDNWTR